MTRFAVIDHHSAVILVYFWTSRRRTCNLWSHSWAEIDKKGASDQIVTLGPGQRWATRVWCYSVFMSELVSVSELVSMPEVPAEFRIESLYSYYLQSLCRLLKVLADFRGESICRLSWKVFADFGGNNYTESHFESLFRLSNPNNLQTFGIF